mmetsp:Transcript_6660/g.5777  ORF Transcript_6660/g.5777 Transcript_6660/m.5777 type:complete len:97 (-) Transcript_6660:824-1114(-)
MRKINGALGSLRNKITVNFKNKYRMVDNLYKFEVPMTKKLQMSKPHSSTRLSKDNFSKEKKSAWMQGKSANMLKSLFCLRGGNSKKKQQIIPKSLK